MIMTMIVVNIHEVKAKLSEYLEAVARGERVVICKRNRPVAELRPVAATASAPRPIGGVAGIVVPPSFFEPLPDEIVDAFYGDTPPRTASRVAGTPGARDGAAPRGTRKTRRR